MAVSKIPRRHVKSSDGSLASILRNSKPLLDNRPAWKRALLHKDTGEPALRFPVYDQLYDINVHAHAVIKAIAIVSSRFSINQESSVYHQSLVQYVRAASTHRILAAMTDVELTEEGLFHAQRRLEEKKFVDPDDIYFAVREREAERKSQGLPPRVRFLKDSL